VVSVLRRRWRAKSITARRSAAAISDLASVPADRYPVLPFMPRAYELRSHVSPAGRSDFIHAGTGATPIIGRRRSSG
jgi:hypothetical protein